MIATFRKKGWMKLMIHTDTAVDKSTSTDDEDCPGHNNEVQEEEYVQENKILQFC